jgi:hypothetical protein
MTYAKACPRVCGSCDTDLGLLATETAEARESALTITVILVFGCTMGGMICRATPAGEYAAAWLEAYEGNDESLEQWKELRDTCKHPLCYRHTPKSAKSVSSEDLRRG